MRTKKVTRYYCDFCSRGLFSRPAMVKHEKGCTANPDRVCSICAMVGNPPRPLAELKEAFEESGADMKWLDHECDGCPMCMLAVCRDWNKKQGSDKEDWVWFDFKAARETFWKTYNEDMRELM